MGELAKPRRRTAAQKRTDAATQEALGGLGWGDVPTEPSGASRVSALVEGAESEWVGILGLVVESGYGLTISATRDGGALSLSLLTDTGPLKRYASHPDELAQLLGGLRTYLTQRVQGRMTS